MQLKPAYPIPTPRLRLRPLTSGDIPALLAYRGDPEVCRYLPFEPMDERVLAHRLATDLGRREITAPGQGLTLGIEQAGDGRLVGDVVLFLHSTEHAGGEIGYVLHPGVTGRGYATEASAAVLDLAFGELGLHRVIARMDARNTASTRVAARLGMRREAWFRSNEKVKGTWSDELVFALLDEEWRARRASPRPPDPDPAAGRPR